MGDLAGKEIIQCTKIIIIQIKTVKEKYKEIKAKNDSISNENLKQKLNDDLKDDKGNYKKDSKITIIINLENA